MMAGAAAKCGFHARFKAFAAMLSLLAVGGQVIVADQALAGESCLRGINLSGAEFGQLGGVVDKDYTYPSAATMRYFAAKGFNSVRLPFRWERLQPKPMQAFDKDELKRLDQSVKALRALKMSVVLDPHNYAQYFGNQINTDEVPVEWFADFWMRLSAHFLNQNDVIFGLMNEPKDMPASQWLPATNAAINAIRASGAKNLILVPGVSWTGAHSWESDSYGGANGTIMLDVRDPADHYAYEVHQYLDDDFSGTKDNCSRAGDAVRALNQFTTWLGAHGKRGYLGEFGAPGGAACVSALKDMAAVVDKNKDRWIGWSYWVAGDWWSASESLNIQPVKQDNGQLSDRPQLSALLPFLKGSQAGEPCPSREKP